jgi:hypothetical protein
MMTTGKPFNDNTMLRDGSGQITGCWGEQSFMNWLFFAQIPFSHVGPEQEGKQRGRHYDFLVGRCAIDVKTKKRTVKALPSHDAHVLLSDKHKPCHVYVFASVMKEQPQLMGWIGKDEFWDRATIVHEGDKDGTFIEWDDAGKLKYSELKPTGDLRYAFRTNKAVGCGRSSERLREGES